MSFDLRPYQEDLIANARRALKVHRRVMIQAATGAGKCLGKGTPVLMFDGTIKPVEDVAVGDSLMGPDSRPRRVRSICSGWERLYRVTPTKGDAYVVNESHILSLRMTGSCKGSGHRPGEIVNLSIPQYLAASKTFRHCAKGWRVGVDFPASDALPIDPYLMGLWLGDGHSRLASITTADPEIVDAIQDAAESYGLGVREEPGNGCSTFHVNSRSRGGGRRQRNPLLNALRDLGVANNKHIPLAYKTASRGDRLALLAGLVDSDGSLGRNDCYDFNLASRQLAEDIVFVARSLGFAAYLKPSRKHSQNGTAGDYWRFTISGDVCQMPVRVRRKISRARGINKNPLNVGITVEPIGVGEYFGFEISGDRLFLLGDFTVTHNTVIGGKMLHGVAQAGKRAFFIVHRQELIEQTAKTLERADVDHGFCANGYPKDYRRPVTLCSVGTLAARLHLIEPPSLIIFDEAHHLGATSWQKIADTYPGAFQVGLSATPERLDGKGLEHFSALVPGPSIRWLIQEGFLSNYEAYTHPAPSLDDVRKRGSDFDPEQLAAKMGDAKIVGHAVEHYQRLCPGASAVVFCCSVQHAVAVRDAFRAAGISSEELDGAADRKFRRDTVAAFRRGEIKVLTSVDLFGEGFDLPEMAAVIDERPTQSLSLTLQHWGRVLRPVYAAGYDLSTREGRLAAIAAGPKPFAVILDHAGNIARHGRPDDDREWTLAGRPKGRGGAGSTPTRTCPNCFGASPAGTLTCEACGHAFQLTPREIERIEGELQRVEREAAAEAIRAEIAARPVYAADSFEAIFEIALARGHKVPWLYAAGVMRARKVEVSDTQYRWALDRYAAAKNYKPGWVRHQLSIRHSLHSSATEAAAS